MAPAMECLFCQIAAKTIPAQIVLENDSVLVFKDIHPQAPTHLLIVPKKHVARIAELSDEDDGIVAAVHRAIRELAKTVDPDKKGFRVVVNNGSAAGQAVAHLHYHFLAGRLLSWPPG